MLAYFICLLVHSWTARLIEVQNVINDVSNRKCNYIFIYLNQQLKLMPVVVFSIAWADRIDLKMSFINRLRPKKSKSGKFNICNFMPCSLKLDREQTKSRNGVSLIVIYYKLQSHLCVLLENCLPPRKISRPRITFVLQYARNSWNAVELSAGSSFIINVILSSIFWKPLTSLKFERDSCWLLLIS